MNLSVMTYPTLLDLKREIDQEIKFRQESQDPVSFRCPECGFENETYTIVHNHIITTHGYGYKRTVTEIVRMYP